MTVPRLRERKANGQPISMLTAHDASFARRVDDAGVDCVLVGDSLGNVIQGRDSTLPVTVSDMVYHVEAVRRGLDHALLLADMPFMSYHDRPTTMQSAARLMQAGAEMVKLEGGSAIAPQVSELVALGIPVCGHLGLTPQHVHQLGGYRVQGREAAAARILQDDAQALAAAGAAMLVLECVPSELAGKIAANLAIPVIGIGAGPSVDGQVLVLYDVLGISVGHRPRFVRDFMADSDSIPAALSAFVQAVRERSFPGPEHGYR
ncbi:MAG: 3-methyl-2-oxobutanoate hydroxymethyltransferase [Wenzhouxiangella sp.]|nr:3-methyl-2-oxobutanoate hydroxymethyltransferase [Wenzhouxiangella sp.]